uniref:Transcription factor bHLH15 n=1 Tax=Nothapodytes nimmoniana TaxID=159386 RepID=A0A9E8Z0F0_NOTNI|nr:transcription factor bHLH15 [Nothapodytes nimmoniana]
MKSGRLQEDEEEEDEEFATKRDNPLSNTNSKDGRNSGKANAIRSKHSVTEQRRRSKINERFQILRDLIPQSDHKRDTASFLLEVIEYVQYLQEKVQKYEGSYQNWGTEPTKLMPWRNSHWRVQSFVGHSQLVNNGSSPGSAFPDGFVENNVTIGPTVHTNLQNPMETVPSLDACNKAINQKSELSSKTIAIPLIPMPTPLQANIPVPVQSDNVYSHPLQGPVSDAQSTECPMTINALNQQEEVTIEGGTISISSAYSQGLLNSLTEALQSAGVDLSQATISVQIDLGKQANRGPNSGISAPQDNENLPHGNQCFQDMVNGGDSDQAQKRPKI